MRRALALGREAALLGEVPVGAVVVKSGEIIGEGYNRREVDNLPTAHAEILAIESAAKSLGSWRLTGCDIYVTLEPCPMCCGAIINARIARVYFGAFDAKAGAACSVQRMFSLPYNHLPELYAGIMEDECSEVLSGFFRGLRNG